MILTSKNASKYPYNSVFTTHVKIYIYHLPLSKEFHPYLKFDLAHL